MTGSIEDLRSELRQAIIQQKTANFPEAPEEPTLAALHDNLRAYDEFVSVSVIQAQQGKPVSGEFEYYQQLEESIADAKNQTGQANTRSLRKYEAYKLRLDHMLELAAALSKGKADQEAGK